MVIKNNLIVVFDLDDTLYKEIDFLKSAYKEIADFLSTKTSKSSQLILSEMVSYYEGKKNVFKEIIIKNSIKNIDVSNLLKIYRNHIPNIILTNKNKELLDYFKKKALKVGLITDGRSVQQRSKIKVLGLLDFFDDVIISEEFGSEKPSINNYKFFIDKYGNSYKYIYIGDNTKKDFQTPNKLGWSTICLLDNGKNIHKQSFNYEKEKLPDFIVNNLTEVKDLLFKTNE